MKTDTIFYRLFQSFPSIFFELIKHPISEAENYRFDSVEVKQLSFRIDGVFLPQDDNPETLIYFCEVQFQKDDNFYGRFFAEIFLYLSKTELANDWQGVIIYPHPQVEATQIKHYQEFFDSGRINRIYLNELENPNYTSIRLAIVQLVTLPETEAINATRQLIQRVREELTPDQKPTEILQLIETILVYKLPNLNQKEIEKMFSLDELKQTRYFQDVQEEARQEGRLDKALETIPRLLALGLSVEQVAEALQLDIEKVREIQNSEK